MLRMEKLSEAAPGSVAASKADSFSVSFAAFGKPRSPSESLCTSTSSRCCGRAASPDEIARHPDRFTPRVRAAAGYEPSFTLMQEQRALERCLSRTALGFASPAARHSSHCAPVGAVQRFHPCALRRFWQRVQFERFVPPVQATYPRWKQRLRLAKKARYTPVTRDVQRLRGIMTMAERTLVRSPFAVAMCLSAALWCACAGKIDSSNHGNKTEGGDAGETGEATIGGSGGEASGGSAHGGTMGLGGALGRGGFSLGGVLGRGGFAGMVESEMVPIPSGTFTMGSEDGAPKDQPVYGVEVEAFEMDKTEVTVLAYVACVDDGRCTVEPEVTGEFTVCGTDISAPSEHPISCVNWEQATTYCAWAGKRLPTEEEWEYAARGTDGRNYPWGNDELDALSCCWSVGNIRRSESPCPVGTFPKDKSPFGVLDMDGNVSEWTSSYYWRDEPGDSLVCRGGSWLSQAPWRVWSRGNLGLRERYDSLGFRCARSLP